MGAGLDGVRDRRAVGGRGLYVRGRVGVLAADAVSPRLGVAWAAGLVGRLDRRDVARVEVVCQAAGFGVGRRARSRSTWGHGLGVRFVICDLHGGGGSCIDIYRDGDHS